MSKKKRLTKFKIGTNFLLLILIMLLTRNFLIFVNYMLALFLHELAHLFVATRRGYSLKLIKLDMFGLSMDLNEVVEDKDVFWISLSGPLFNLLLCLFCMSTYWLFPVSYLYLNTFCFSNLVLAVFNLLPVYPLDGGKIFKNMFKTEKTYKIVDKIIRWSLAFVCISLFFWSMKSQINIFFLILALFFLTSKANTPTFTVFKYKQNKSFDKVVILKVDGKENLFQLLKKIKHQHFTIFYLPQSKRYLDENEIVTLATKYPLTTKCEEIK